MFAGLADADLPHEPLARLLIWAPQLATFSREISLGVYLLQSAVKLGVYAIPYKGSLFTLLNLALLLPAATLVHYGVQRPITVCVAKALAARTSKSLDNAAPPPIGAAKDKTETTRPAQGDP